MTTQVSSDRIPTGSAAAALISSGIGCLMIGLLTTGAVISEGLKSMLNWYNPAGPLTGKTGVAVLVWLIAWLVLHNSWKEKDMRLTQVLTWTLVLIALGLLGTFPPFFEAFHG
jgi:uncharacterized protein YybS (DUF2232 family)